MSAFASLLLPAAQRHKHHASMRKVSSSFSSPNVRTHARASLLPMAAMAEAGGPTNAMPLSSQLREKSVFSDRNP